MRSTIGDEPWETLEGIPKITWGTPQKNLRRDFGWKYKRPNKHFFFFLNKSLTDGS